jgi:hypothetical protein
MYMPEWAVSRQDLCPQCDSPRVRPMAARAHEAESTVAWFECIECGRMWNVRKHPPEDPLGIDASETPDRLSDS